MRKNTVSVCMATFNGERFVSEQISSILGQIDINDELVIVDDCSTDETVSLINSANDPRIRLFQMDRNVGHVGAFEMALSNATHDIIFLSDQDDIWNPDKYQITLQEFESDQSLMLVVHSLSAIDANGHLICSNWHDLSPVNKCGHQLLVAELFKPRVFGSASAFRRGLLGLMLPFPNLLYAHDHWLVICAAMNGNFKFLAESLVLRRIHESNVTPRSGVSLRNKIYYRMLFLRFIFIGMLRLSFLGGKHAT